MSYDVHIDVSHHPKHADDFEQTETTGFKCADPEGHPLRTVANCLRMFADELQAKAAREELEAAQEARRADAKDRWLEKRSRRV